MVSQTNGKSHGRHFRGSVLLLPDKKGVEEKNGVFFDRSLLIFYQLCSPLIGLLGFGAFQGLVGWWMVRSGLTEPSTKVKTPRVSPYRLAFHLGCGATLFLGLTWAGIVALPCVTFSTAGKAALKKLKPSVTVLSALGATTFLSGLFSISFLANPFFRSICCWK
eukprot:GHVN01051007.1.p1 GENE.GHVN01051007.1~~GHVN01051007.1.p1  ORF type:complete len:164 (-),score=4.51 GHVN01051007.1:1168-1659(-)